MKRGALHVRPDEEPDVEWITRGYELTADLCWACGLDHGKGKCQVPPSRGLLNLQDRNTITS